MSFVYPHSSWRGVSALHAARRLGLSGGLKLCLDGGDSVSLPAGSATWNDLSGNAHHFNRGSGSGSDAADPSINGTAGQLVAGNYLGFDGGDYLTLAAANPTWVNNIHKDNAAFTLLAWLYVDTTTGAERGLAGTNGWNGASGGTGFGWQLNNSTNGIQFFVMNAGAFPFNSVSTLVPNQDAWSCVGISINESGNSRVHFLNGEVSSGSATYSSPASGDATYTMQIAARGNAAGIIDSGSRFAGFCAWEGRALSVAEMRAFYQATRGRFGL